MSRPVFACLVASLVFAACAAEATAERREGRRGERSEGLAGERPLRRSAPEPPWAEVLLDAEPGSLDAILERHGGRWRTSGLDVHVVRAPRGRGRAAWLERLEADPDVRSVEPNHDAIHPACRQMGIDILDFEPRSALLDQLALESLGEANGLRADGTIVAIVDSGVEPVEGLEDSLLPAIDVVGPGHRGRARALQRGASAAAGSRGRNGLRDDHGHGTALASLIVEAAPGVMILPVLVVDGDCVGTSYEVALGIVHAVEAGADVINVSLSSPEPSNVLAEAVAHAHANGVVVVAAGGNDGEVEYPASLPEVLAVTAVGPDGWPATFAAVGPRIDLAAPGVEVIGRGPGGTWLSLTGTSPSAALVSAAAALAAANGEETASVLERRETVRRAVRPPVHPTLSDEIGTGVLDLTRLQP